MQWQKICHEIVWLLGSDYHLLFPFHLPLHSPINPHFLLLLSKLLGTNSSFCALSLCLSLALALSSGEICFNRGVFVFVSRELLCVLDLMFHRIQEGPIGHGALYV